MINIYNLFVEFLMHKKCPSCGNKKTKIVIDEINFDTLMCKTCDHIWDEETNIKAMPDMQVYETPSSPL